MSLYEFNLLGGGDKAKTILEKGVLIMTRHEPEHFIKLYSMFDFYVEAWYQKEDNKFEKFRTFKNTKPLEPYLEEITLEIKP